MKINKKLSAAITLSLMLGVYGSASAGDSLYGADTSIDPLPSGVSVTTKGVTTVEADATNTGADYTVSGGAWLTIFGGYALENDVSNNSLTINTVSAITGTGSLEIYGGYANVSDKTVTVNAENNIVTFNGGNDVTALMGGRSIHGGVSGNTVNMNASVGCNVKGGQADGGLVENNIVSFAGTTPITIGGDVYGGYILTSGSATGNKVGYINSSGEFEAATNFKASNVYGGWGGDSTSNNEVWLGTAVDISGSVYGARTYGGKVNVNSTNGNTVTISGGKVDNSVYGGRTLNGNATNNIVTVTSGTVGHDVNSYIYGGYTDNGAAAGNTIEIDGSTSTTSITAKVIGGWSHKGTAGGADVTDGNTVTIKNGYLRYGVTGGEVDTGIAQNNNVIIEGGSSGSVYGGSIKLGLNAAAGNAAIDNKVEVKGGIIRSNVYGGYLTMNPSNIDSESNRYRGNVEGNEVVISNDKSNPSIAGDVYGGYTDKGNAGITKNADGSTSGAGNTVTITSGSISGNVYGGKVGDYNESTYVSYGEGDAVGNLVSATGGTVTGKIYGGFTPKGAANNNTVEISGANKVGDYVIGARSYGTDKDSTADNNIVKIKDSSVGIVVVGGRGFSAKNNSVTIDNSSVASGGNWVAGGISGVSASDSSEGTQDNTVTILGASQIKTTVYGGYSNWNADPSSNNSVSIKGASATSKAEVKGVNGGYAFKGIASGNKVGFIDEAGKLVAATNFTTDNNYSIRGGRGYAGAQDNEVQLGDGVEANGSVYGGIAIEGSADSNKVTISGDAKVKENVYGGNVDQEGDARSNEVSITGGEVTGSVYGGWTENGTAGGTDAGNTVSINGATERVQIDGNVKGGYTKAGTAIGNKVGTSTNAATNFKAKYVYGGHAITGAEGNEVHLGEGVEVTRDVRGGYTETGAADRNIVTINGNSGNIAQLDDVFGGYGATADKNEVHLGTGVVVTSKVYGGNAVSGTANSNIVNISGNANVKTADIYGGKGASAGTGNTLNIDTWSGKTMKSISDFQVINVIETKDIEAGSADGLAEGAVALDIQYAKLATEAAALKATDEIVFINTNGSDDFSKKFKSAEVNGIKVGDGIWRTKTTGFGVDASKAEFQIDAKKAFVGVTDAVLAGTFVDNKGNTTSEKLVLDARAKDYENIYGAYNAKNEAMAAIVNLNTAVDLSKSTIWGNNVSAAGNTLNVKANGVKVKALKNFENMNFYVPATAKAGDTMVEVKEAVNLTGVKVAAGFHNDTKLVYGDKVKLINAPAVSGMDGVSEQKVDDTDYTKYDVNIYQADAGMNQVASGATSLVAELVNTELTENAKSLVETRIAAAALLEEGSDMLASASFANAESALRADVEQGAPAGSISIFGAVNGNKARVKSGSYVDVKGWNFNLGAAKELVNKYGKLIFAPVVEYGRGSYDSYLNNGYHGDGKTEYVGGGLMAKKLNKGGSYVEGSVRAGKLSADYQATGGNYDSDSMYLAAHLGLGKVVKLSEKNSLDYYGKYFYSRQGSDDTTVNANGKDLDLHFDAVESHRTRLGGRFNHALGETNTVYAGLAWQHEFSSTARATLDGMGTPAPSMKGDSGILELGVKVSEADKYDLDFGVNGSIGKKKGAGLSLNFNWKF